MMIHLPTYVSALSAKESIKACWQIASAGNKVDVDAAKLKFVDPFGMALLAATFHQIMSHDGLVRVYHLNDQISGYMQRMDVFQGVQLVDCANTTGQRHDRSADLVEVTRLESQSDVEDAAYRLALASVGNMHIANRNEMPDEMTGYTEAERLAEPIQYALNELLENALTHAKCGGYNNACVWVASQYYKRNSLVRLGVVDNGCGFLASLRNHSELRSKTHLSAILTALKPYVSRNRDLGLLNDSVNEGIGLTVTNRIAERAGGRIFIASGDAVHSVSSSYTFDGDECWQGVAIGMELQRQKLTEVHFRELIPPRNAHLKINLRFQ